MIYLTSRCLVGARETYQLLSRRLGLPQTFSIWNDYEWWANSAHCK